MSGLGSADLRDPALGPFVLVADVEAPVLDDRGAHHLRTVRRRRPGDPVCAGDGGGGWVPCRLGAGAELAPVAAVVHEPPPDPLLTVGFALVKGERPELVVQKLTEIGVDRIVPFRAGRSVVRWDESRAAAHHERLVRVAREAVEQCRRAWVPEVRPVTSFATLLDSGDTAAVALADLGGGPLPVGTTTLLVGPEGGWTPEERSCGAPRVDLGPHVLRAETAAILAGAALLARAHRGAGGWGSLEPEADRE